MSNLICFDIGTTNLKIVYRIEGNYFKEIHSKELFEEIRNSILSKYNFETKLAIGTGSRLLSKEKDFIFLEELNANASIAKACEFDKSIIVNIGTGTSFMKFDNGEISHLIGTGVGGGTLLGLSKRMLGITNYHEINTLAEFGDINAINLTVKDVFEENTSWFQSDITISNFGNNSLKDANIAVGICSLVAEPIMSILKAHIDGNGISDIIFAGGVSKNKTVRKIIKKYSEIFQINSFFLKEPDFGTCFGAISMYENKKYPNLLDV
ncbi:acetate and sugar kinases/Hsc70/actin family protein [Aureivirga marina]|uniref:hypothetical protein n=1 Tax=Aureivirga marina TaxID=1182451 RepID=UPI0018CA1083|nr:hypothetical protein [Aureivirga marina]